MSDFGDFLGVAGAAVDVARNTINATSVGSITAKGDRDMVTEVDYAVEREVREFLADETPHVGFLGEEEGSSGEAGPLVWTLDPVDGTANYVRGLPLCGVSLALLDQGKPVVGVIDLPFLDTRYTAAYGIGARSNGEVICVSRVAKLSEAIISMGDFAVGIGAEKKNIHRLRLIASLAARVQRVRMFGSAAIDLAWVAHGRTDACVMLVNNPWDVAAGVIIAREAGAAVVSVDGSDHRADSSGTIAVAPHLLEPLMSLIRQPDGAGV
jgi:myo-inositol-1(or 4)-monophosphatase